MKRTSYYKTQHGRKNIVPSIEARAANGNPIFALRQWLERFRQFCKREHKMDSAPLLKGEEITATEWTGKEQAIQEDFLWGVGPEGLYQITRGEYKTKTDSLKLKELIRFLTEFYMTCRKETFTITAEISSGENRPKNKCQKNFGED